MITLNKFYKLDHMTFVILIYHIRNNLTNFIDIQKYLY